MKRILFLTAFIFTLTSFGAAANQAFPRVIRKSGAPGKSGIENASYERRFISYDLKTVKKKERAVEGEEKMIRYERNHRIGHIYRL